MSSKKNGWIEMYVVFEGIDGSGKTTQIERVKQELEKWIQDSLYDKLEIIAYAEPMISLSEIRSTRPNQELTLRYALQRLPYQKIIEENEENIVLSDRSYISSMAYQGLAEGHYWVHEVNKKMYLPNIVVFFKTNPSSPYLEQVQDNYEKILSCEICTDIITVETNLESIAETTHKIVQKIKNTWENKFKTLYNRKTYYGNSK